MRNHPYRPLALVLEGIANRTIGTIEPLLEALGDISRPFADDIQRHEWESLAYYSDRRGL